MSFFDDLTWRGLIHQTTAPDQMETWLATGSRCVYAGFGELSAEYRI